MGNRGQRMTLLEIAARAFALEIKRPRERLRRQGIGSAFKLPRKLKQVDFATLGAKPAVKRERAALRHDGFGVFGDYHLAIAQT